MKCHVGALKCVRHWPTQCGTQRCTRFFPTGPPPTVDLTLPLWTERAAPSEPPRPYASPHTPGGQGGKWHKCHNAYDPPPPPPAKRRTAVPILAHHPQALRLRNHRHPPHCLGCSDRTRCTVHIIAERPKGYLGRRGLCIPPTTATPSPAHVDMKGRALPQVMTPPHTHPIPSPAGFLMQKKMPVCPVVSKICTAPTDGTEGVTDGGWRVTDGGWRVADGGWRVTDGGWRQSATRPRPGFLTKKQTCPLKTPIPSLATDKPSRPAAHHACGKGGCVCGKGGGGACALTKATSGSGAMAHPRHIPLRLLLPRLPPPALMRGVRRLRSARHRNPRASAAEHGCARGRRMASGGPGRHTFVQKLNTGHGNAQLNDGDDGADRPAEGLEGADRRHRGLGHAIQPQPEVRDDPQSALGAHKEFGQVVPGGGLAGPTARLDHCGGDGVGGAALRRSTGGARRGASRGFAPGPAGAGGPAAAGHDPRP